MKTWWFIWRTKT